MEESKIVQRLELENGSAAELPPGYGVIVFRKQGEVLYCIRTNNLKRLLEILRGSDNSQTTELIPESESYSPENDNRQKLMLKPVLELYDQIVYYTAENEIENLVNEKRVLLYDQPERQQKIRLYDNYPYLALNYREAPYLSLKDDTTEDFLYIGPFTDRFLLLEMVEIIRKVLNSAEDLSDLGEQVLGQGVAKEPAEPLEKLIKFVLTLNNDLSSILMQRSSELADDLEFNSSVILKNAGRILEKYYLYLLFFHTAKNLNLTFDFRGIKYQVRNGLLESRQEKNRTEMFSAINNYFSDYEKKEYLAIPKENLREMWTLFEKIREIHPEKIDEIYGISLINLRKGIDLEV
jgi:hypothetical protein